MADLALRALKAHGLIENQTMPNGRRVAMRFLILWGAFFLSLAGANAQPLKCDMIDNSGGSKYLECDPAKADAAKESAKKALKAQLVAEAPSKPGWAQSAEEFTANMAVKNAKNDEERVAAQAKADAVRQKEEKRQAASRAEQAASRAAQERRLAAAHAKAEAELDSRSSGTSGNWKVAAGKNRMDNTVRLSVSLDGNEALPNNIRPQKPTLVIRCEAGKVDLIVNAGTHIAGPSDELGQHNFRAKFDDGKPEAVTGTKATSSDAVFFPKAQSYIKRLRVSKELMIEVTPYQFAPATTTFKVAGLDQHREMIRMHCGV